MPDMSMWLTILGGAVVLLVGALISCLIWFAMRVLAQLDRLENKVTDEMHKLDKRIYALEAWRDGFVHGKRRDTDAI